MEKYNKDFTSPPLPIACFFKLILEPRLDLQKLEIPRNFMLTHGDGLSNIIYLALPTGKVWEFNLVISEDNGVCLRKGWPEFGEYYSLSYGDCLVFYYQGRSQFNVIILDTSGCEIYYPIEPKTCRETPIKKEKTNYHPGGEPCSSNKGVQTVMDDDSVIVTHNYKRGAGVILFPSEIKRIRNYTCYNCKHPSFAAKMQQSSVEYAFLMQGMPLNFAEKFLDGTNIDMFNLRTSAGKSWRVSAYYNNKRAIFSSSGWKTFALDNKLRVGDICIFELINKQDFKVHILRDSNAMDNRDNSKIKLEVD